MESEAFSVRQTPPQGRLTEKQVTQKDNRSCPAVIAARTHPKAVSPTIVMVNPAIKSLVCMLLAPSAPPSLPSMVVTARFMTAMYCSSRDLEKRGSQAARTAAHVLPLQAIERGWLRFGVCLEVGPGGRRLQAYCIAACSLPLQASSSQGAFSFLRLALI